MSSNVGPALVILAVSDVERFDDIVECGFLSEQKDHLNHFYEANESNPTMWLSMYWGVHQGCLLLSLCFIACSKCPRVPENKLLWFGHEGLELSFTTTLNLLSVRSSVAPRFTFKAVLDFKKPLVLRFLLWTPRTPTHVLELRLRSVHKCARALNACTGIDGRLSHSDSLVSGLRPREMCQWVGFLRGLNVRALHELQLWRHSSHLMVCSRFHQSRRCVQLSWSVYLPLVTTVCQYYDLLK